MEDSFFGFDAQLPSKPNILGKLGLEDQLLTADVEDEYDALNDETFGKAANDDWEEAHEKLAVLVHKNGRESVFDDSLLDDNYDESNEDITQSISKLILEDELDDPAIMTVSRNCRSSMPLSSRLRPCSPPPPAILEILECGSPKTHSIWSAIPKDSGLGSNLASVSMSRSPYIERSSSPLNSASDNVFESPAKMWRVEELERDLLSSSIKENRPPSSSWPLPPQLPTPIGQRMPSVEHQNQCKPERMLTREEVEQQMNSELRMRFPNSLPPTHIPPPILRPNIIPPIVPRQPLPNQMPPVMTVRPNVRHLIGGGQLSPDQLLLLNARIDMIHNRMRGPPIPNLPPGFNPNMNSMNFPKLMNFPPRSIVHPHLQKQFPIPAMLQHKYYNGNDQRYSPLEQEDEYAGLMSHKEKDWLVKIQLLQLKAENPYVEDYYYTTMVARQCQKKFSENSRKGSIDAPELILPQTPKPDCKTFVPTQYEGSLGKLQAVSVNFPRKVIDISVEKSSSPPSDEEEEDKARKTSLVRYRRVLVGIERLYDRVLEIEDEERRILAKPDAEAAPHRANIEGLTNGIHVGLLCNAADEDHFGNVMAVRKGRTLLMRAFKLFTQEQKMQCFTALMRCLPYVLKKDQNDLVFLSNLNTIVKFVLKLSLPDLVSLCQALDNGTTPENVALKGRPRNFAVVLKDKFGSSVICTMLMGAELLHRSTESFDADLQAKWSKIVLNLMDCVNSLLNDSRLPPPFIACSYIIDHFQRFATDQEALANLREKLFSLEKNAKNNEDEKV